METVFKDYDLKKIESDWLEGLEDQKESLISFIQKNAISNLQKEQSGALEKLVKKRLGVIGHTFNSQEEFYSFCSNRIHRVGFGGEPFRYEIYLDFIDENNRGTLLASYSAKINIELDNYTATFTLG